MKTLIFKKNLIKHIKTAGLKKKISAVNSMKYLPAYSKEWRNIVYSFNKANMKNITSDTGNINKIIKSYFNLFFKDRKFLGKTKFIYIKRRRKFLRRIFVSDANIKYTNDKAKITLFTINKEKKALKKKYDKLNKRIIKNLLTKYKFLHKLYLNKVLKNKFLKNLGKSKVARISSKYGEEKFHLTYNTLYKDLRNSLKEKIWTELIQNHASKYFKILRKYNLLYSLNQFKFNKFRMLPKLTYLLNRFLGRKIQYNIINLKSITYHPDIFTDLLALKISKERFSPVRRMNGLLHKTRILKKNRIQERSKVDPSSKLDMFRNNYRDLKIVSHIGQKDLSSLVTNILSKIYETKYVEEGNNTPSNKIHNLIFKSIGYKHLSGIKLKVSGRLTKRYRADRSLQALKWKGGLKNIDSSFKGLSVVSFRGNDNSNVSYSLTKSKRRIGSFAVKGWIGGK
jgi:hypothetical protein